MKKISIQELEQKYLEQLEYIRENSPKAVVKDPNKTKRINKALKDFQYFVKTYFTHKCLDINNKFIPLAQFHKTTIEQIVNNDRGQFLVEMARGHAKSTVFSLFMPIWLSLRGETKNMILISKSKNMAKDLLLNIQAELEANNLLISDFGDFVSDGNWSKEKFIIKQGCCFNCKGRGESPRGTNWQNIRPDLIILDDVDDDEMSRSDKRIKQLIDWYKGPLYNAVDIAKRFKIVLVGNKFAHNMLLTWFEKKALYKVKINAYDEDGNISWPERFKKEDLEFVKKDIGEISFRREYMNTPITEGAMFKNEWIQYSKPKEMNEYDFIVSYCDPSYSKNGDYKAVVTIGYINKEYHIIEIYLRKTEMKDLVYYMYNLHEKYQDLKANHMMYLEGLFAQAELWKMIFDQVSMEKNYHLPITYDEEKKTNKESRVETMTPIFSNGWIYFNEEKKSTKDFTLAIEQLLAFPEMENDDFPDALHSATVQLGKKVRNKNTGFSHNSWEKNRSY